MSSERHGEEHTDSFTEESRTTDQRRKEPGVRAIDNKMPQLVFVWAGGTETPKKKQRMREREWQHRVKADSCWGGRCRGLISDLEWQFLTQLNRCQSLTPPPLRAQPSLWAPHTAQPLRASIPQSDLQPRLGWKPSHTSHTLPTEEKPPRYWRPIAKTEGDQ